MGNGEYNFPALVLPIHHCLPLHFMTNTTATALPVMEAFYTLQGEGFHQGRAAYFIRLGGCDVGCFWCDVKDSWDAAKHPQIRIEEIVKEAKKFAGRLAVITGGEPLMHNLDALTTQLHDAGFETNIETSGSSPFSGKWEQPEKRKLHGNHLSFPNTQPERDLPAG